MAKLWTEKMVASRLAQGRGEGTGADYKPWIEVRDISSSGRKHLVPGTRFGRDVHVLSDVEYGLFLLLDWQDSIVDINEQYPLPRDLTLDVARQLGITHPYYPGTSVPTVMTVDFMVTRTRNGVTEPQAFNAKTAVAAQDERSMLKLEIQRSTLEYLEIPHYLVFDTDLPKQKVSNLDWLRNALVKPGEIEPSVGYFEDMTRRFNLHAAHASHHQPTRSLGQICSDFDLMHSADPGTGLRAARILMSRKAIRFDLAAAHPAQQPMAAFTFVEQHQRLQAVGGGR